MKCSGVTGNVQGEHDGRNGTATSASRRPGPAGGFSPLPPVFRFRRSGNFLLEQVFEPVRIQFVGGAARCPLPDFVKGESK